jgi:hypothetical protein
METKRFQLIVGNIGTVCDTSCPRTVVQEYKEYIDLSNREFGRASGEDVTLMVDGEIRHEHIGWLKNSN